MDSLLTILDSHNFIFYRANNVQHKLPSQQVMHMEFGFTVQIGEHGIFLAYISTVIIAEPIHKVSYF